MSVVLKVFIHKVQDLMTLEYPNNRSYISVWTEVVNRLANQYILTLTSSNQERSQRGDLSKLKYRMAATRNNKHATSDYTFKIKLVEQHFTFYEFK